MAEQTLQRIELLLQYSTGMLVDAEDYGGKILPRWFGAKPALFCTMRPVLHRYPPCFVPCCRAIPVLFCTMCGIVYRPLVLPRSALCRASVR